MMCWDTFVQQQGPAGCSSGMAELQCWRLSMPQSAGCAVGAAQQQQCCQVLSGHLGDTPEARPSMWFASVRPCFISIACMHKPCSSSSPRMPLQPVSAPAAPHYY